MRASDQERVAPQQLHRQVGVPGDLRELAAGVFVERGDHVTIRACEVHDNANGLFIGTAGGDILTTNVLIESNYIHDNGLDDYNKHNVYNEASNVIYQFNRFGPTRGGHGNNIKERSAGVVIRYNWIEDGAHLIDLVDAQEARPTRSRCRRSTRR